MAFADPQSITVLETPYPMPRINTTNGTALFSNSNAGYNLRIKQSSSSTRFRREVRIDSTKLAAHPVTGLNTEASSSLVFIIDEPKFGFNDADLLALKQTLVGWLTDGNVSKLLLGEN